MYRIEFIHKKSVYNDIIENWTELGKANESENGFVFDELRVYPTIENGGVIRIFHNDCWYFYNVSDFYRVKITEY